MAEITKELKTRIALRTKTYADWTGAHAGDVLLKGEIGICEIPSGNTAATTAPTVLFKVGDGTLPYYNADPTKCLKWASALAADVYEWAKKPNPDWTDFPVLPIEVVDNGTGKFVTDFTYADNKLTITRADVDWSDVKNAPDFALAADLGNVSTLETTAKTAVGAINEHDAEIGNLADLSTINKNDLVTAINEVRQAVEVGGTGSVVTVRKDNENKYTVRQGENDVAVSIEIADGTLTVKGENGLTGSGTFGANQAEDGTITLSHANTSDAANLVANGRKYVTGLTFDDYGHVTGYTTGEEVDQDLSHNHDTQYKKLQNVYSKEATGALEVVSKIEQNENGNVTVGTKTLDLSGYKTKQTAVTDPTASGNATEFIATISQNDNGEIVVTKKKIEASDLGLSSAMHFVGALTEAPATAKAGDVYLNTATKKEYVYDDTHGWVELGDEGSHALKSVSITGTGYLTGGGTLEANRTIDIEGTVKTKIDHGEEAYGWGNHANAGYALEADLGPLATITKGNTGDYYPIAVTSAMAALTANSATNASIATNATQLGGQYPNYYATAQSVTDLDNSLGELAKMQISKLEGFQDFYGIRVASAQNATQATNAANLDNHPGSYYATAESVTDITKDDGTIDTKIAAFDETLGDLAKKDKVTADDLDGQIDHTQVSGLGALATAVPNASNMYQVVVTNANHAITASQADGLRHIMTGTTVTADKVLTEVHAGTGLKVTTGTEHKNLVDGSVITAQQNKVEIDTDVVFILDCNW